MGKEWRPAGDLSSMEAKVYPRKAQNFVTPGWHPIQVARINFIKYMNGGLLNFFFLQNIILKILLKQVVGLFS